MDEAAKKLGMSRNELIVNGINLMVNFDTHFYKRLESYIKRLNVPISKGTVPLLALYDFLMNNKVATMMNSEFKRVGFVFGYIPYYSVICIFYKDMV